jgi:hypothetical protein
MYDCFQGGFRYDKSSTIAFQRALMSPDIQKMIENLSGKYVNTDCVCISVDDLVREFNDILMKTASMSLT